MCRLDDDAETIAKTSGRAIPDVEVKIIDAEGRALPPNEPGEIVDHTSLGNHGIAEVLGLVAGPSGSALHCASTIAAHVPDNVSLDVTDGITMAMAVGARTAATGRWT